MVEHINGEIYLALCADDVWLEMQECKIGLSWKSNVVGMRKK